jgi:L-erythro-3,5-diaminohexanoate dehydrogenase
MERFGFHRVLDERRATTPQAAERLDASLPARDTELVVDVELLNLDSTSASQLHDEAARRGVPMAELVMETVATRGKLFPLCFVFLV